MVPETCASRGLFFRELCGQRPSGHGDEGAFSVTTDHALAPGVDSGLGPVGEVQLGEYVADVILGRLLADEQAARDLGVAQPLRDQLEHLELPVGEVVEYVWLAAPGSVQLPHHPRGHLRMEDSLATGRLADGVGQLLRAHLLENIGEGAGLDSGEDMLVVVVGGEHYDARARRPARQTACGLYTIHTRHDQVHQRHVGCVLGREPDGLFSGAGLGDHGYVALRLEKRPHPLAHQRVIVDQKYGYRLTHAPPPFPFDAPSNGQTQMTRVPSPGALSTSTRPPSFASRSLMLCRPKPSPVSFAGSNPCPSSARRSIRRSAS